VTAALARAEELASGSSDGSSGGCGDAAGICCCSGRGASGVLVGCCADKGVSEVSASCCAG
jgi:hypothetical protein